MPQSSTRNCRVSSRVLRMCRRYTGATTSPTFLNSEAGGWVCKNGHFRKGLFEACTHSRNPWLNVLVEVRQAVLLSIAKGLVGQYVALQGSPMHSNNSVIICGVPVLYSQGAYPRPYPHRSMRSRTHIPPPRTRTRARPHKRPPARPPARPHARPPARPPARTPTSNESSV